MSDPELPLPHPKYGTWPPDFNARVDAYRAAHDVSRAEVFRRIAAITGNSTNGLSLRYYQSRRHADSV